MAQRVIDFVRHGQYGDDGMLTRMGRSQVALLAARYRDEGGPTELWASPMLRARETGAILAKAMGLTQRTVRDLAEGVPNVSPRWAGRLGRVDAAEVSDDQARFERVLARILKRARGSNKHLVLAGHGNASRYLWTRALGLDPLTWWEMHIHHASMSRLVIDGDGIRAVRFNDVGHLPLALQTQH